MNQHFIIIHFLSIAQNNKKQKTFIKTTLQNINSQCKTPKLLQRLIFYKNL